ncbi:MAG: alpha/beta hydrolase [Algicola sp.]|nr:alpha/beta hydrolase [Algicola sp.]
MKYLTTALLLLCSSVTAQVTTPTIPTLSGKFDAGGLKLFIECFGKAKSGQSTVIVQDGLSGFGSRNDWKKVIGPISKHHQICHFDRAGLGKSDAVTGAYHVKKAAEQLHALLGSANVKGPYLLVGHSLASYHVRLFNHLYSSEVSGILLVDPSVDGMMHDRATGWRPKTEKYSEQLTKMMNHSIKEWNNPHQTYEKLDYKLGYQQLISARDFADKPYRLLMAKGRDKMSATPPGDWPKPRWDRILQWHYQGIKKMKTLSTQAKVFFSTTKEHGIHDEEPKIVIKHIQGLLRDIARSN